MLSGVLPLVVDTPPGSTVAAFCQHVDAAFELLIHQRFPIRTLECWIPCTGRRQSINSQLHPCATHAGFGAVRATAAHKQQSNGWKFGLFFIGSGDKLSETAGSGGTVRDHWSR